MSTTYPRTVFKPMESTWPKLRPALRSVGQSGRPQLRKYVQLGRTWTETYAVRRAQDADVQGFLAQLMNWGYSGTQLTVDYWPQRLLKGVGTGSPLVKGASQVGSSLVTDGWTHNITGILKAGDIFTVNSINTVYELTADANSDNSGNATLAISPDIYVGSSPADDAVLTINTTPGLVVFTASIAAIEAPTISVEQVAHMLRVTFEEWP